MSNRPQHPLEGEIIPPGAPLPRARGAWTTSEARVHRVYAAPIGPLGFTLLTLAAGVVAGVVLVFLLGIAIFGLAAVGVLAIAGVIAGLLRGPSRPLR